MRLPGIEPGWPDWESGVLTVILQPLNLKVGRLSIKILWRRNCILKEGIK